jgi:hypothetical protein
MIVTAAAERELIVSVLSALGAPPAISPFGGAKGSGLGLALEVLVATLTASALGRDVHGTLDADDACNKGDVFLVADPAALPGGFRTDAVSSYLDAVLATPVQEGAAAVRVPGDRARAERARRQQSGAEIPDRVWHEALELARGSPRPAMPAGGAYPVRAHCVTGILRSETRRNGIHGDGTKSAGSAIARAPDAGTRGRRGWSRRAR